MSGSLNILGSSGQWNATTANNLLSVSQSSFGISFFVRVNSFSPTANTSVFESSNLAFHFLCNGFSQFQLAFHGANQNGSYSTPIQLNIAFHVALAFNATGNTIVYFNGTPVLTIANIGNTPAGPSFIKAGWDTSASGNVLVNDLAIWAGSNPTQADVISLRDRTATPATVSNPASAWWTLEGVSGLNPNTGDAGLHDQIGLNNFTSISGGSTNAVYSSTDLIYEPTVTLTSAEIARGGALMFLFGTNPLSGPVLPAKVIAINGTPTILKNGVPATIQGPYWSSVQHEHPHVGYQIVGGVVGSDIISYSIPDSFVTTTLGSCNDASGIVSNYVNSYAPGQYGYPDFNPPDVWKSLKVGYNGPAEVVFESTFTKNIINRVPQPNSGSGSAWSNITSYDSTGYPLAIGVAFAATSTGILWISQNNNGVSPPLLFPSPMGLWTFWADEHNISSPMSLFIRFSSSVQLVSSSIVPGTVIGGVEFNKQFLFTIKYIDNPTSLNPGLTVNIQTPNHLPGPNTLMNIRAFEPGNIPVNDPRQVLNDNFVRMLTPLPGISTPIVRCMEALTGSDGLGGMVVGADYPSKDKYGYSNPPASPSSVWPVNNPGLTTARFIPIRKVRKYDTSPSGSPFVYAAQNYLRTIPSNIPDYPYMWDLNALGLGYDWGFPAGEFNTPNVVLEFETGSITGVPVKHNLQTGQPITMPATAVVVPVTNDQAATGQAHFTNARVCVFVTSPTTFMIIADSTLPKTFKMGYVLGPEVIQNIDAQFFITPGDSYCIEDVACIPNFLNNTAVWVALNHCLNDEGVTAFGTRIYNQVARGTKVFFEFSNEILIGNPQNFWINQLASIEGLTIGQAVIRRTNEMWDILDSIWGADESVVRVFQPFINAPGSLSDALVYAQNNSYKIHKIATAIYLDMDASPTFTMAGAQICASDPRSIAFTAGMPVMPMQTYQDYCQYHTKYNQSINGPNGILQTFANEIKSSGYGQGGGTSGFEFPLPTVIGYECSFSLAINQGVSLTSVIPRAGLTHDFMYHYSYADTEYTFLQMLQQPGPAGTTGLEYVCLESLNGLRNAGSGLSIGGTSDGLFAEPWCKGYIWQGQLSGDGRNNHFWAGDLGGTAPTTDVPHDLINQVPNTIVYNNWIIAVHNNQQSQSISVSPSVINCIQNSIASLVLTGTGTSWNSGSSISITNSVTGNTTIVLNTFTVLSATVANVTVNTNNGSGSWFITIDGINSPNITINQSVQPITIIGSPINYFVQKLTQLTTIPVFYRSLADVLNQAEVFGPQSVDYAIYPDSKIQWPSNPPPFSLIIPSKFPVGTTDIGGGRFAKTFESHFELRIIGLNTYDISYKDTILTTSQDDQTGIYTIVQKSINALEQAYVTDSLGNLTLVEWPYAEHISSPKRYKGSNEYCYISIVFRILLCENLPSNIPP